MLSFLNIKSNKLSTLTEDYLLLDHFLPFFYTSDDFFKCNGSIINYF